MTDQRRRVRVLAAVSVFAAAIFGVAMRATSHATWRASSAVTSHTLSYALPAGASGYHVSKTIPVGGEGFWDYATVDSEARRVYISHGTHVVVLDADTQAVEGAVPDTQGVHPIAIRSRSGTGFVPNGRWIEIP